MENSSVWMHIQKEAEEEEKKDKKTVFARRTSHTEGERERERERGRTRRTRCTEYRPPEQLKRLFSPLAFRFFFFRFLLSFLVLDTWGARCTAYPEGYSRAFLQEAARAGRREARDSRTLSSTRSRAHPEREGERGARARAK